MKKNLKLLFATVLSVAALVGCEHTSAETSTAQPSTTQDSSTTSSTAAASTPADSSSSSSKASSSSKVDTGVYYEPYEFNIALANYEVTIRTSSTTLDLYGTDACYISSSSDSYGYMKIDSKKSVWEYELDDQNQVSLTDCIYGSVDDTVDLSSLLSYYSAIDVLAEDTSGDNWVEARKAHTYTTTDANTISALLVLAGVSSSSSPATATSLTLTSVKDGTLKLTGTATITTSSLFGSSTSTEAVNVIFSNFGENENAAITSFLANPVIPAYTDFDSELKTAMTTYSGAALPFDSKFTAYSGYSVSSTSGYYQYQDMKCGNLVSEYSTLLTQAGFTKKTSDDDEDSTDSNSATFYKVKSAASDISAGSNYVVQIAYMSKEDIVSQQGNEFYGSLYQDGVFIIMGYLDEGTLSFDNITSINTFFSKKFLKADNTALLPQMNITPAEIAFADGTAYYNQYSSYFGVTFKGVYMIEGSFDVANDALTAMQTYEAALTAAGYSLATSSSATYAALSATNHSTAYQYSDTTYTARVSIKLGEVSSSSSSGDATTLDDGDSSTSEPDETVAALDGSFSVTIFVY